MSSGPSDQDVIALQSVTRMSEAEARRYLEENGGNLEDAIQNYWDEFESAAQEASASNSQVPSAPVAPAGPSSSRPPNPPTQRKKFGTINDFQGGAGARPDDDDDDNKEQEYFAGGDKSGLAVQDPGNAGSSAADHIRRLMDTARRHGTRATEDPRPRVDNFTGTGQTLGGDDAESRIITNAPTDGSRPQVPMVERTLHLWADGFSVDDGPLYRYDDPANRRILNMINAGSAPLDIMNVENGQAVDVKLNAHRGENYVQPKPKYKAFGGSGQRLGSPTPGVESSQTQPPAAAQASASTASSSSTAPAQSGPQGFDAAQPSLALQIRLADGTRLPARFNTAQTIGDVYEFVDRAGATDGRTYNLATTFPTKDFTDRDVVLGDVAEFKRGGVLVQKWT